MDDLRGFTLMDSKPFAIVLNNSDAIQARIFTLLHEYAHLFHPTLAIPIKSRDSVFVIDVFFPTMILI
jgi:Zn-dependent peptidase ImmA (M78 family)